MTVAADHEASVKARAEELAVIAKAKKILQESSGGGVEQTYSFIQVSSKSKNPHVIAIVKELARQHHSTALAQLASRIAAVAKYGNSFRQGQGIDHRHDCQAGEGGRGGCHREGILR